MFFRRGLGIRPIRDGGELTALIQLHVHIKIDILCAHSEVTPIHLIDLFSSSSNFSSKHPRRKEILKEILHNGWI